VFTSIAVTSAGTKKNAANPGILNPSLTSAPTPPVPDTESSNPGGAMDPFSYFLSTAPQRRIRCKLCNQKLVVEQLPAPNDADWQFGFLVCINPDCPIQGQATENIVSV
jgi:hypothetical protein